MIRPLEKPYIGDINLIISLGKTISLLLVRAYSLDIVKVEDPYEREYQILFGKLIY